MTCIFRIPLVVLAFFSLASCGLVSAIYDENKAYEGIRTDGYYLSYDGSKYYFYDNQGGYLRRIDGRYPDKFFPIAGYGISASPHGKKERKLLIIQYGIEGGKYAHWIEFNKDMSLPFRFIHTGEQNLLDEKERYDAYEKIYLMRNKRRGSEEELRQRYRETAKPYYSR